MLYNFWITSKKNNNKDVHIAISQENVCHHCPNTAKHLQGAELQAT